MSHLVELLGKGGILRHESLAENYLDTEYADNRNEVGYRGHRLDRTADFNVCTFGCSWTEGQGVPLEQTYASIACDSAAKKFNKSINNWNFGHDGKSNDYITRQIISVVANVKVDYLFVCFTHMARREIFSEDGIPIDYTHGMAENFKSSPENYPEYMHDTYRGGNYLSNKFNDEYNFVKNFLMIREFLNARKILWSFAAVSFLDTSKQISGLFKRVDGFGDQHCGFDFEKIDEISEDDGHPNWKSHLLMGDRLGKTIAASLQ